MLTPTFLTSLFNLYLSQDTAPPVVQDAPLMGKFKLKGKGEKQKLKAAKQHISMDPPDLMNGEDGECPALLGPLRLSHSLLHALQRALRYISDLINTTTRIKSYCFASFEFFSVYLWILVFLSMDCVKVLFLLRAFSKAVLARDVKKSNVFSRGFVHVVLHLLWMGNKICMRLMYYST